MAEELSNIHPALSDEAISQVTNGHNYLAFTFKSLNKCEMQFVSVFRIVNKTSTEPRLCDLSKK